jgi:hypothetical protein
MSLLGPLGPHEPSPPPSPQSGNSPPAAASQGPQASQVQNVENLPPGIAGELMKYSSEDAKNIRATLSATYAGKKPLPKPSVKNQGTNEESVILWRGCKANQLVPMAHMGSAGGRLAPKALSPPPSGSEVIKQVGEQESLPEFTFNTAVAEGFGTGQFVAAFEIQTKYLAKGSVSEGGFVTSQEAPVKLVAWKMGRPFIQPKVG